MILQTLLSLGIFIIIFLVIFYPLGYLFISKNTKELDNHEIVSLSLASSMVLFVILTVFTSIINARFLMIYLITGISLYSIFIFRANIFSPWKFLFQNPTLATLLLFGILVQGFLCFPNGYFYNDGLRFWSSQAFDGFWHLSLMDAIGKSIPPQMPLFSGANLQNYHYLVDIFMGEFNRIYNFFSPLDLYFRYFPIFFSFLMGLSVYSFMNRLKNRYIGYWSVFFTYFVGSFGFVWLYLKSGRILGGETSFWVSQLNTVIANPPHASAIILLCTFLLSFLFYTKQKSWKWFFVCVITGFIIAGFKVSGGVVLLAGVGAVSFVQIIVEKKFNYLYLFLILLAANFVTINLVSKDAESYLIFEPWWFIRTMVVVKLGLVDWELRRQTYLSVGRFTSYLRVLQLEGTAFVIFVVGNFGMRIVGFPLIVRNILDFKNKIIRNPIETLLITIGVAGFVIPMLFLQKGIVYSSIQFMQYSLLIAGFYGAEFTYIFLKKVKNGKLRIVFTLLLIAFSVPTVVGNFVEFYGGKPNTIVSNNEIAALNYLKTHSNAQDIILTPPFDVNDKYGYKSNPLPIYAWSPTSYVSSLAQRSTYLSGEDMLIQTGYDMEIRLNNEKKFFLQTDTAFNRTFLKDNNISYLYIPNPAKYLLNEERNSLKKVFSNDEVDIYKVK